MDRTDEDRATVKCDCGWSTPYKPPLVARAGDGIDGRRYIQMHDSAGRRIVHGCERFGLIAALRASRKRIQHLEDDVRYWQEVAKSK